MKYSISAWAIKSNPRIEKTEIVIMRIINPINSCEARILKDKEGYSVFLSSERNFQKAVLSPNWVTLLKKEPTVITYCKLPNSDGSK